MLVSRTGAPARHRAGLAARVCLGVTLSAAVLAGCQSNPKPPPLDDAAASSPPPTASTTKPAPTLPAEAKGTSEAAAKAFVRHYIALINYAMATGDAECTRQAEPPRLCVLYRRWSATSTTSTRLVAISKARAGESLRSMAFLPRAPPQADCSNVASSLAPQARFAPAAIRTFKGGQQSMTFIPATGSHCVDCHARWSQSCMTQATQGSPDRRGLAGFAWACTATSRGSGQPLPAMIDGQAAGDSVTRRRRMQH